MNRLNFIILTALALAVSMPVSAATVAYWDFEDGTDGQNFTDTGQENGSGGSHDTVTGILMRGWDPTNGPSWSSLTRTGTGLSMQCADKTEDGYVTEGALHGWSATAWTIECDVYLEDVTGWQTLIGRDGSSQSETASDFYLQKNDEDGRFRINYMTAGGQRWILDSDEPAQINTWYHLAAVSDGEYLWLWIDKGDGLKMVGELDISAQSVADNALPSTTLNWTFGRGWFDGGYVDKIDGYLDNIRISDEALYLPPFEYNAPANGQDLVPVQLASAENDLVFTVNSATVVEVDVQFGTDNDPNLTTDPLSAGFKIVDGMSVTAGQQYTVDLVGELTSDLANETTYYWKVIGYEPNTVSGLLTAVPGPVRSFTTIPAVPVITKQPANVKVVDPAINPTTAFTIVALNVDSYKWYKEGSTTVLSETDTLTIDATFDNEGYYYCDAWNSANPSVVVTSNPARMLTKRMMGWWKFDGDLLDSIQEQVPGATPRNGILKVHDTIAGPGDPNWASEIPQLVMQGSDAAWFYNDGDYVEIADSVDYFNYYHQGLTISCWYLMDVRAGWTHPIIKLEPGNANVTGYLFGVDGNNRQANVFIFENGLGWPGLNSDDGSHDVNYRDGNWHMMTATYDAATNTARLYADGYLVDSGTPNFGTRGYPNAPLRLGGSNLDGNPAIRGGLDDVRVYNYALTEAEVADLYLQTTPEDDFICIPGSSPLVYDLNGDCRVGLADLTDLALNWLGCERVPAESCGWIE